MIVDFRELDDDVHIEADLCIVGAGAAGITIARTFIGSTTEVCLVESGGLEYDQDVQSLYEGNNIGRSYNDLSSTRLRYFGGTTNHWNGGCLPLSPSDFESRSWVPFSGWPFSASHLAPYYERAQPILELTGFKYQVALWPERAAPWFRSPAA
jgi:choline dehydrogenase-like flavoprotein